MTIQGRASEVIKDRNYFWKEQERMKNEFIKEGEARLKERQNLIIKQEEQKEKIRAKYAKEKKEGNQIDSLCKTKNIK